MEAHISQEQADEYAIGALEPEIERLIALHLAECATCRDIVRDSERLALALTLSVPSRKPPRKLRSRVFQSAGIARPSPLRRAWSLGRAAAGLAAVIVAIAAFTGMVSVRSQIDHLRDDNRDLQGQVSRALSQEVEIAALTRRLGDAERTAFELDQATSEDRDLLLALLSPTSDVAEVVSVDEKSTSIGRLVWDEDQKRVWFVAAGLDQLPAGETYQIWVSTGGRYVSIGTFNSDSQGFARYGTWLPQGLKTYESAVVTIERDDGAPERSGPSVFVSDLSRFRR